MKKMITKTMITLGLWGLLVNGTVLDSHADVLLQQGDLTYEGAFRVPQGQFGSSQYVGFAYGGYALAYNQANNSMFVVGHVYDQMVAEIGIPQPVISADVNSMKTASVLQGFSDITEGHRQNIAAGGAAYSGSVYLGGLMVFENKLIGTAYAFFDGAYAATMTHFTSGLTLGATGDFTGIFQVGSSETGSPAGFVDGYMAQIPADWQSQFGGPALTGNGALPVVSRTSYGPAAYVFDPGQLGRSNPVSTTPLVYYPDVHPTLGAWDSTNPYFNGTTEIKGLVFPEGSRSVLFFGRHGTGAFCYGIGTADQALASLTSPDGEKYCYDPTDSSKGTHGYPYVYQVWAYDAYDLLDVKNGVKKPWDVTPYAIWSLSFPIMKANAHINGVAYDAQNQRIFVSQAGGDQLTYDPLPLIHVFSLNLAGQSNNTTESTTDTVAPVVGSFSMPSTASSLTVSVTGFAATDNKGVTGYMITESATAPSAGAATWLSYTPASFTFSGEGTRIAYAWARDDAGNVSASRSASVTITLPDTMAPSISAFSTPSTASSLTVAVSSFTASDNKGVTGYMITESTTAPSASATSWLSSVPTSFTFSAAGTRTAYAWAKDAAGNVSAARSASVVITLPDTTAPQVAITSPASSSTVSGTVTVAANASDNVGMTKVEFYVDGSLKSTATTASYSYSWDSKTASNGSHTLMAKAYDAAGNTSSNSIAVTVSNTTTTSKDTTAPTVVITSPASSTNANNITSTSSAQTVSGTVSVVSGVVPVIASASDNVGVTKVMFYVNGSLKATNSSAPYSFNWNTRTVKNGTCTLVAKAYDAAGNVRMSPFVVVKVKN